MQFDFIDPCLFTSSYISCFRFIIRDLHGHEMIIQHVQKRRRREKVTTTKEDERTRESLLSSCLCTRLRRLNTSSTDRMMWENKWKRKSSRCLRRELILASRLLTVSLSFCVVVVVVWSWNAFSSRVIGSIYSLVTRLLGWWTGENISLSDEWS